MSAERGPDPGKIVTTLDPPVSTLAPVASCGGS